MSWLRRCVERPAAVGFFASVALGLFIFNPSLAGAEGSLDSATRSARSDLEAVLGELKQSRETVAEEKVPLVRRQRELEAEVARLRQKFAEAQRVGEGNQTELQARRSDLKRLDDQYRYQQGLLEEYLRELETTLPVSELETFAPLMRDSRGGAASAQPSLAAELEAVRLSLARLRDQVGGRGYEGEAVGPEGMIAAGRFLEIGPVVLFSDGNFGGLIEERVGSLKAHLTKSGADASAAIKQLVETGRGNLPLDVTLGQASRREEARTTLTERVRAGGVVMFPILALAVGALVIAILKWIQIAGIKEAAPGALQKILDLLDKGQKGEAAKRAAAVRGPVGELLGAAVENAHERREILEEILYEKILRTQPHLERYLPFLALTAATAPLLGLLGTVTGMINTFQLITLFGTGDARTLSGGISEALITTQFGLGVAIVALLVHALLSRKAKGVIANMEQTEAAFLNGLAGSESPAHD